jgi:hypothetical protein
VLGSSNRGGSRIRKKNLNDSISNLPRPQSLPTVQEQYGESIHQLTSAPSQYASNQTSPQDVKEQQSIPLNDDDEAMSNGDSALGVPQNPSDAWQLLRDVADRESDQLQRGGAEQSRKENLKLDQHDGLSGRNSVNGTNGINSYRLVREGYLEPDLIHMLVARYAEHYHPYLPLVPRRYFDPSQLDAFAVNEKHLLTAVLTISSKDLIEQPHVHACCSRYMHDLISGIAAGHDVDVEGVEALLLLAEWEPQGLRNHIHKIGRGEEDRSAWMHVGIALRTGYFLALDRTAFRQESVDEAKIDGRKRIAWANCYVSDRLISVRIGRAFWSRGPGPMTGLSTQDFPSLQPLNPGEEDYAKIFQATLDLTQLYSNVHDVLYSGMRTSGQMMLMGDYVKYVDEFRMALARWNRSWGTLACSSHIKVTLQMSYEYLCLYTNAFVFQAAISQAISSRPKGDGHSLREHLRNAFSNVGAMPDARFIWASVLAAKGFLTLLNTAVDPVQHLRYYPLRFYMYTIYSAVFLYKARSYGVMDQQEESTIRQMIFRTIEVLKRASISPEDPGSRYAGLLELLWMTQPKTDVSNPAPVSSPQAQRNSDTMSSTGSIKMDDSGYFHFSPANDFSWLDLGQVSEFVNPTEQMTPNMLPPVPGFQSPAVFVQQAQQNFQYQQQADNNPYNWQFDLNGNLLF